MTSHADFLSDFLYVTNKIWIMKRKQCSLFRRIFTVAFDRLFQFRLCQLNFNDCHAGARNRRKANVEILRNPVLCFFSMILRFNVLMKGQQQHFKLFRRFLLLYFAYTILHSLCYSFVLFFHELFYPKQSYSR